MTAGARPRPRRPRGRWLREHRRACLAAWSALAGARLAGLMTVLVVAVALALPAALGVLLSQTAGLARGLAGELSRIALFLEPGTRPEAARALAERVAAWAEVAAVDYVSPKQALAEARRLAGLAEPLRVLEDNPFPPLLLVSPTPEALARGLEPLARRLGRLPGVEDVQVELVWAERLEAFLEVARRVLLILGLALAAAAALVVGNTVRLTLEGRREEIAVMRLLGGTEAYVRRPYLYEGLWLGLLGAMVAWALVAGAVWALAAPVARLAALYGGSFSLRPPGVAWGAALAGVGALLGWAGAWLAVRAQLRRMDPA